MLFLESQNYFLIFYAIYRLFSLKSCNNYVSVVVKLDRPVNFHSQRKNTVFIVNFINLQTEDLEIPNVFPISLCWVPEPKNRRVAKTCRDTGRLTDRWVGLSKRSLTKSMMEMMDCLSNRNR